ncbi:hypothetical protein [Mycoplasmopsis cricetuli]|uniref:hypothetical protein n=1 Tax=Mycoplasmopsis cricetuli TaxID=171283 RepID=UPI00047245B2|nr:hypothetical protein [Mycoplasmopsis cricetuli]
MKFNKKFFLAPLILSSVSFIAASCGTKHDETQKNDSQRSTNVQATTNYNEEKLTDTSKTVVQATKENTQNQENLINNDQNLDKNILESEQPKKLLDDSVASFEVLNDEQKNNVKRFNTLVEQKGPIYPIVLKVLEPLRNFLSNITPEEEFSKNIATIVKFLRYLNLQKKLEIQQLEEYKHSEIITFLEYEKEFNNALKKLTNLNEFDNPNTSPFLTNKLNSIEEFVTISKNQNTNNYWNEIKKSIGNNSNHVSIYEIVYYLFVETQYQLNKNEELKSLLDIILYVVYNEFKKQNALSNLNNDQKEWLANNKDYIDSVQKDPNAEEKIKIFQNLIDNVQNDKNFKINTYSKDQQQKDFEKVKEFYKYLGEKKEIFALKKDENGNFVNLESEKFGTKLQEEKTKLDEYVKAIENIYNLNIEYNINRLKNQIKENNLVSATTSTNGSETLLEKLVKFAKEKVEKYKMYRFNNLFSNVNIPALIEQKEKLDVYFDQLNTVAYEESLDEEFQLFKTVSEYAYYSNKENGTKTSNKDKLRKYFIITNLIRFDEIFNKYEDIFKKYFDKMEEAARSLTTWLGDKDGEKTSQKLKQEYGKYFVVDNFDNEKLENSLKDIRDLYSNSQKLFNQLQKVKDNNTAKEFLENFENMDTGYKVSKKKYDEALLLLQNAEQNMRKQIIINNAQQFKKESEEFINLVEENIINDKIKPEFLKQIREQQYHMLALNKLDVNNEDKDRKEQDVLASAWINIVDPQVLTPLQPLGHDLIITLKTPIDRIWFYSVSIKEYWDTLFKEFKELILSETDSQK